MHHFGWRTYWKKSCIYMYMYILEPGHEKMCLMSYANNKGADQPAHSHSLISVFVICCLDGKLSLDSIAEISRLASFCGCTGRFVSGLVGNSRRHIFSCRGSLVWAVWDLITPTVGFYLIVVPTCVKSRNSHLSQLLMQYTTNISLRNK